MSDGEEMEGKEGEEGEEEEEGEDEEDEEEQVLVKPMNTEATKLSPKSRTISSVKSKHTGRRVHVRVMVGWVTFLIFIC